MIGFKKVGMLAAVAAAGMLASPTAYSPPALTPRQIELNVPFERLKDKRDKKRRKAIRVNGDAPIRRKKPTTFRQRAKLMQQREREIGINPKYRNKRGHWYALRPEWEAACKDWNKEHGLEGSV